MRVEFAASFLGLAVVLSLMRLWLSPASVSSPTAISMPAGRLVDTGDARNLMEELRQLRSDMGRLQTAIKDQTERAQAASVARAQNPPCRVEAAPAANASGSGQQLTVAQVPEMTGPRDGAVLLSVITNPSHFQERAKLRAFYRTNFSDVTSNGQVRVVFVVGKNFYLGNPPKPLSQDKKDMIKKLMKESDEFGDILWTDGREALPHVGKATEKSAAWWQTGPTLGKYGHYCKSDDDSLIHLSRLKADLAEAGERALYGYVAFRGWRPNYQFQACGIDTRAGYVEKALHGQDMGRDENCSTSVGPFPYAGGNLVCMGQVLARQLSSDPNFDAFVQKAHERNDHGTKCSSPLECAGQPWDIHMWHHEDAGISYNLFRSIIRSGLKDLKVVKIQPWIHIQHWLRNNVSLPFPFVVIHNLKDLGQLTSVMGTWNRGGSDWERAEEGIKCETCSGMHGWKWSRTCCSGQGDSCDAFCEVDPNDIYQCCTKMSPAGALARMKEDERRVAEADREKRRQWEAKKAAERAAKAQAEKERFEAKQKAALAEKLRADLQTNASTSGALQIPAGANADATTQPST